MIAENVRKIQQKIGQNTIFVAVTKGRSLEEIAALVQAGVNIFGENKVQEAIRKGQGFRVKGQEYELHLIGHLQTNKVTEAVQLFDMIQSVDSLRLLQKIESEAKKVGKVMRVLIQVNISKDPKKYGVMPDQIFEFLRQAHPLLCSEFLSVEGLMTIVEHTETIEERRVFFKKMKRLFDDLKNLFDPALRGHIEHVEMKYLSMGMSEDYEIAIEEGANMVRIGRALFENTRHCEERTE